jgi:UDP-N-acetylmuramate dehydrogenase
MIANYISMITFNSENLKNFTTSKIGCIVDYFFKPKTIEEIKEALEFIKEKDLKFYILGGGSNTIFDDKMDSNRAIISLLNYSHIELIDYDKIAVQSGTILQDLVDFAQLHRLSGLTGLNRIPGTVGGAVLGNAGAYGCEICQTVESVTYLDLDDYSLHTINNKECDFQYRDSFFKKYNKTIILDVELKLKKLIDYSKEFENYHSISTKRDEIYPKGFQSPGSTFKNLPLEQLTDEELSRIPEQYILKEFNKVPVGKLLEHIGAKGRTFNNVRMRPSHSNIMEIIGDGEFVDVQKLVFSLQKDIKESFNINIEPEIRIIKDSNFKKLK